MLRSTTATRQAKGNEMTFAVMVWRDGIWVADTYGLDSAAEAVEIRRALWTSRMILAQVVRTTGYGRPADIDPIAHPTNRGAGHYA